MAGPIRDMGMQPDRRLPACVRVRSPHVSKGSTRLYSTDNIKGLVVRRRLFITPAVIAGVQDDKFNPMAGMGGMGM